MAAGPEAIARECTNECFDNYPRCRFVQVDCKYKKKNNQPVSFLQAMAPTKAPTTSWRDDDLQECLCYFREDVAQTENAQMNASWYLCRLFVEPGVGGEGGVEGTDVIG